MSTSEIGATRARITGLISELNSVIRMTAIAASTSRPIMIPGRMPAVMMQRDDGDDERDDEALQQRDASPRHSHRIRIWVL